MGVGFNGASLSIRDWIFARMDGVLTPKLARHVSNSSDFDSIRFAAESMPFLLLRKESMSVCHGGDRGDEAKARIDGELGLLLVSFA